MVAAFMAANKILKTLTASTQRLKTYTEIQNKGFKFFVCTSISFNKTSMDLRTIKKGGMWDFGCFQRETVSIL